MSKKRLYEIAKELGKESKEVVERAKELGLDVKSHSSSVEAVAADKIVASFASAKKKGANSPEAKAKPTSEPVIPMGPQVFWADITGSYIRSTQRMTAAW